MSWWEGRGSTSQKVKWVHVLFGTITVEWFLHHRRHLPPVSNSSSGQAVEQIVDVKVLWKLLHGPQSIHPISGCSRVSSICASPLWSVYSISILGFFWKFPRLAAPKRQVLSYWLIKLVGQSASFWLPWTPWPNGKEQQERDHETTHSTRLAY